MIVTLIIKKNILDATFNRFEIADTLFSKFYVKDRNLYFSVLTIILSLINTFTCPFDN